MRQKRWVLQETDGRIHIVNCNCEDGDLREINWVTKTAFEVSRLPGNNLETYKPDIHSRALLEVGVAGHRPIRIFETVKSALPVDNTNRNTWGWEDGEIVEVRR